VYVIRNLIQFRVHATTVYISILPSVIQYQCPSGIQISFNRVPERQTISPLSRTKKPFPAPLRTPSVVFASCGLVRVGSACSLRSMLDDFRGASRVTQSQAGIKSRTEHFQHVTVWMSGCYCIAEQSTVQSAAWTLQRPHIDAHWHLDRQTNMPSAQQLTLLIARAEDDRLADADTTVQCAPDTTWDRTASG
jgi:hypothetical protein